MLPLMARNVLESIRLLANVSRLLADRCIDGITANVERCRELAESSPSIVTPLNKYIGYEEAAIVAKQSLKEKKTIRQVVLERGYVEQGKLTEAAARRGPRRPVDDPPLTARAECGARENAPLGRPLGAAGRCARPLAQ